MNIQIWSLEEIKQVLASIRQEIVVTMTVVEDEAPVKEYRQGFDEALHYVAHSFGLTLPPAHKALPERNICATDPHFWMGQDIAQKLRLVYTARQISQTSPADAWYSFFYRHGFEAALRCLATAFRV